MTLVYKIIFVVTAFVSINAFNRCEAQSIVGKWKMVSTTSYFTAEGAAKQGKTSYVNPVPSTASVVSDFKSDHTYLTTTSSATSATPTVLGGTWSLNGDKLTITVDSKYKPRKGVESSTVTISINGNSLIMTNNIEDNKMVSKMTTTAERI
jgi:Lipocalin-like domain